jgi:hypothetical protein
MNRDAGSTQTVSWQVGIVALASLVLFVGGGFQIAANTLAASAQPVAPTTTVDASATSDVHHPEHPHICVIFASHQHAHGLRITQKVNFPASLCSR